MSSNKHAMRQAEKVWRKNKSPFLREQFKEKHRTYNRVLREAREKHVSESIQESSGDSKKLYSLINKLTGRTTANITAFWERV